jgi:hypothetical protein
MGWYFCVIVLHNTNNSFLQLILILSSCGIVEHLRVIMKSVHRINIEMYTKMLKEKDEWRKS